MTASIAILLLPCAALWPWLRSVRSITEIERVGAAIGLGLASSSTAFFLWRVAGGDVAAYPIIDTLGWIAIGVAGCCRCWLIRTTDGPAPVRGTASIAVLAVVLAFLCGVMLLDWIRANPHGRWDAWALWNLRARFLATPSGEWRKVFDPVVAIPNYPLLLPSAVARAWLIAGETTVAVPIAISLAFTVATVLTVTGSLLRSRGVAVAAMGMALVAVPGFVLLGAAQMADVPLAFYTVLAVSLLGVRNPRAAELALAGAALGFAGWTKNEGLVVATVLPTCYALITLRREGFAAAGRSAVRLAIGLGPVLAIVALFKILLAPGSAFVAALLKPSAMASWFDWARVGFVARSMTGVAISWGGWPIGGPMWLLAMVMLAPRRARRRRESAVRAAGLLILVQLVTFCSVYVMTPYDVAWHLYSSWHRLIAQIWPTLVWWICSTRGDAEGVDVRSRSSPIR